MNAKEEFLHATKGLVVLCADIYQEDRWSDGEPIPHILLKLGYTKEDLEIFLSALNFEYDAGFGGQELFGTIWCADNIWLDRGEYDGSEWWDVHRYPTIPVELNNIIPEIDDYPLECDYWDGDSSYNE